MKKMDPSYDFLTALIFFKNSLISTIHFNYLLDLVDVLCDSSELIYIKTSNTWDFATNEQDDETYSSSSTTKSRNQS